MSDFLRLLVIFLAAANPAAVALASTGRAPRPAGLALVLGLALAAVTAMAADSILDALDIEPETFRIAAGVVLLVSGAVAVWRARIGALEADGPWYERAISPMAIPLLFSPAVAAAALSYGADEGAGKTIAVAAIALAIAAGGLALAPQRGRPALDGLARLFGALLVAVGVGLIVEGVRDI